MLLILLLLACWMRSLLKYESLLLHPIPSLLLLIMLQQRRARTDYSDYPTRIIRINRIIIIISCSDYD